MKKLVLAICIGLMFVIMPAVSAYSSPIWILSKPKIQHLEQEINNLGETGGPYTLEDPPEWANGNFSGVWGIDIWGEAQIPLGWLYGYYRRQENFGYFYAAFADFWEENDTNFMQGLLVGPFMFGSLGYNESANDTLFVGLGGYNTTHFYWRVMGQTGPTFFMYGEHTRFED